jgi:HlyD family secretion protein
MKRLQGRTLALLGIIVPLLMLFIYVALRSGPLAPVAVTVVTVQVRALSPSLFGIGNVEARYSYKIGPTFAGRLKRLEVQVGDKVKAGQVLGAMDPVDLDQRTRAQDAAFKRNEAALREAEARQRFAQTQMLRYEQLFAARISSEETLSTRRQELQIAEAARAQAYAELERARYDREALVAQRNNLRLIAPADGVVSLRNADPGTTLIAGQAAVELIDPKSLWINVRFDQSSSAGLAPALPAHIVLRSGSVLSGRVLRVEPMADAVTEEMLAKVSFAAAFIPALGELAEVTLNLPALPATPVIPNAAIQREGDKLGVWQLLDNELRFTPVKLGASDLEGWVQVLEGLKNGDQLILYSEKALTQRNRIHIVERIQGVQH